MGVFDIMKKGHHKSSTDDLHDIRMQVIGKQEEKQEPKHVASPTAGMEVKLIKITNDLEGLKAKMDQNKTEILQEVNKVYADVESLSDLVKYVPKETLAELRNIKQTQPGAYDELKQVVSEKVKASVVDVIDANIIRLIKDNGDMDSHKLLEKVENSRICSKNTLYIHLSRLTEKGLIVKKHTGHEVMYSAPAAPATAQPPAAQSPVGTQPAPKTNV